MKRRRNPFSNSYYCQRTPDKVRYLKASFAWVVGARQMAKSGEQLYVYRCPSCEGWHLTSTGEQGATRIETNMSKVIDLEEKRAERSGPGFWLQEWDYDDDALGFTDGDRPVVFIHSNEADDARGICMSRETTVKLRDALTKVLESPHAPWIEGSLDE